MNQKLNYFFRSVLNFNQVRACPNCGGTAHRVIDRKYAVTRLLKCDACKLNFRHPVDTQSFSENFYQSDYKADYSEETVAITDLPSDDALHKMMTENFSDRRDHSPYVEALLKKRTGKVLDYGCSWGYSVFQLRRAGYDAEGFEISSPRAEFGKKLGVSIHHRPDTVGNGLDMVMSNHAIEHLPVISDFISFASSRLTEEGIFMAFCPNGSEEYRRREPATFHVNWGLLHPNYLDIEFAAVTFKKNPFLILTGDWSYLPAELAAWNGRSQSIGAKRDGKELLIISKPNVTIR